jgi:hypothetical protein
MRTALREAPRLFELPKELRRAAPSLEKRDVIVPNVSRPATAAVLPIGAMLRPVEMRAPGIGSRCFVGAATTSAAPSEEQLCIPFAVIRPRPVRQLDTTASNAEVVATLDDRATLDTGHYITPQGLCTPVHCRSLTRLKRPRLHRVVLTCR